MAFIFSFLIELIAIGIAVAILFAGNMRTTGGTNTDGQNALSVFMVGTFIAALIFGTHWIGW
jgi:hypothetical protein